MIDRQGGRLIFECDTCDSTFEGEKGDEFATTWNAAKSEGWKAMKIGRDWVHACPDCELDQ
jgi:rubredoxin